ncbi:LacI family transcriptional regulator [Mumia zhuanghuii]|uniref:LacI family DNA-binding transcriptional regulator n=2 Tax=Mumia TaxID=1546255 RepID=A0ABW1QRM6_9ACTN|nr:MULTISPECIES: LacI family DNA-binding transcriptional regulator [Mumia]KAA1422472.1 LacI family transcriptional regulator [Mumia zhuanghuii]
MARGRTAPRLVDVAERAGVSLATASRALSGREGVSPAVAERVQAVAAELGYVVNAHARSLAGGSASIVGLIVHQIDDPYFSEIAAGVISVAYEHGITVQICHSARDPENELRQIRTLVANNVRAIIVAGSGYVGDEVETAAKRELAAFQDTGGRVAVIGRHALRADAVLPDNEDAGAALAEHLVGLGHRQIAIASGTVNLTTVVDRLAGIERALADHGIDIDDLPLVEAEFTRDGGAYAAERILAEHPGSTAIIALNDAMAIGALATLRAHGVAVPSQMSVVGFDDVTVAADLAPSLTTVRLPMAEMGADALMMALKDPSSRPRRRHTGHELMVRDSSGPVRA